MPTPITPVTPGASSAPHPTPSPAAKPASVMDFLKEDGVTPTPAAAPTPPAAAAQPAPAGDEKIPMPESPAHVTKMTVPEMDALMAQEGLSISMWDGMTVTNKKAALKALLFPDAATEKGKLLLNDPLQQIAHEIENLKDHFLIVEQIKEIERTEGRNDFKLGGLIQKLTETVKLDEGVTIKDYIEATFSFSYKKARELINNYTGILFNNISWDDVSTLGWSKIAILIPILNPDNVKDWVQKAKDVNNITLRAMVKDAQASGTTAAAPVEQKNFKTKTFNIALDQESIIDEAVADAMKKGNTDHKGTALAWVCQEYVGNTSLTQINPLAHKKVVDELAAATQQIADLKAQLEKQETAAATAGSTTLAEHLEFYLKVHGDPAQAIVAMLESEDFKKVFPMVEIPEVVVSETLSETAPSAEAAPAKKKGGGKKKT